MTSSTPGPIMVFGHSHMVALHAAFLHRVRQGDMKAGDMVFTHLAKDPHHLQANVIDRRVQLDPEVLERLQNLIRERRPRAVVLLLTGNEHNIMGMFVHPGSTGPADVDLPESGVPLSADHLRIPLDLLRAELRFLLGRLNFRFVRWIAEEVDCPLIVAPPPPPIVDAAHIRANPGIFAEQLSRADLSPAPFRHKLWRLDGALRREIAAEVGARCVEVPEGVFDENGLGLGAAYRGGDATHANQDYGLLLLERVLDRVETAQTGGQEDLMEVRT